MSFTCVEIHTQWEVDKRNSHQKTDLKENVS